MPPTEHQKKEWVEGIKRDFPRLAAQEELVQMMVDVYASNPKHIQALASRLQRTTSTSAVTDAFPDGIVQGAVRILDTPFANISSQEDNNKDGPVA